MKKCHNCSEEIPDSAKVCPHCGARIARPIYKRWWFWLLLILVAIIIIAALGGDKDDTPPVITNPGEELVETISPSPSSEPSPTGADRTLTTVGQTITTKNFTMTLEAVNITQGDQYFKPDAGKEFVELVLVLENTSDGDLSVTTLAFDAYQDGYAVSESISASAASDLDAMMGTVAAGKKLRGRLAYELPVDWKELEIDVDMTFVSDSECKIILQNQ